MASMRRERKRIVRRLQFVCQRFVAGPSLVDLEPHEAGFVASRPYHGQSFDNTRFRVVEGSWDHEHCFICMVKIEPGAEYWRATPPHEVELCLACYTDLFGPISA